MSWVAAAVVGGAVIGGVASNSAAKKTAGAQKDINNASLNTQYQMHQDNLLYQAAMNEQNRQDFEPYRQVGLKALPDYQKMVAGEYDGEMSPAAQWTLQEATKAQNRQDAARGISGSGGASTRLGNLAAGIAANDYQMQYNRILDALKLGTGAAETMGNYNQNTANAFANSTAQMSNNVGQAGANSINITGQQGAANQQFWQGLGSLPMDAISVYNANKTPKTTSTAPATFKV